MARMLEVIENVNSTNAKVEAIERNFSSFQLDWTGMMTVLLGDYGPSNIGEKRAISWLASILGVHEEEIKSYAESYGDLGEGVYMFGGVSETPSDITITTVLRLFNMDCSSINGQAYSMYEEILRQMDSLELKWFVRYWLKTPRNGVSTSTVTKAMAQRHGSRFVSRLKEFDMITLLSYAEANPGDWEKHLPEVDHIGRYIKPMLAKKLEDNQPLPEEYVIDIKYDGNRYQIHHSPDTTMIFNRAGKLVTEQYPDIVSIFKDCKDTFIVDGEIYPINDDGSPAEHKKLGTRVHSKDKEKAVEECPVQLVVFDMMYDGFESLLDMPYRTRLEQLEKFVVLRPHNARLLSPDRVASYNYAINEGYEGIMIKDLNAPYESKRSKALLKHKPPRIDFDVVILSTKYGGGKRSDVFGTFEMGVVSDDGYTSVGSVGSGLSDEDLLSLTTQLKRIVERYDNKTDTFHVLPRIVLQVTADLVTRDANGNYGLRFPRVQRIRHDKYPADCNTLDDVRGEA